MRSTRRNSSLILEKLHVAAFRGLECFMLCSSKLEGNSQLCGLCSEIEFEQYEVEKLFE